MINVLKDIAFRFKIDPIKDTTIGHAATLVSVLKVLGELNKSYQNYLAIEISKNPKFKKAIQKNPKLAEALQKELELVLVDLKFSSFEAAIAPNLIEPQIPLLSDTVSAWKGETFNKYKEDVLLGKYSDVKYITRISKSYSQDERARIFQPIFNSIGNGSEYKLKALDAASKVQMIFHQPKTKIAEVYAHHRSAIKEDAKQKASTNVHLAYIRTNADDDTQGLKKSNVVDILYAEKMEHDTYPYRPKQVFYDGVTFELKHAMECDVTFESELYFIRYAPLKIEVWAETREKAEEAFGFQFYSIYHNFGKEQDINLSPNAIKIKRAMNQLVDKIHEAKKNKRLTKGA